MTLQEAIQHTKDIIQKKCVNNENKENDDCLLEHKQLLEWLEDYKNIKEKPNNE